MSLKIVAKPAFSNKNDNPFNWLLYTNLLKYDVNIDEFSTFKILIKKYDVWHIHWPDTILKNKSILNAKFKAFCLFTLMKIVKLRGTRIIWTVHNLQSHEGLHQSFERKFWDKFISMVDGTINLTEAGYTQMLEKFKISRKIENAIIPHGHYLDIYSNQITPESARDKLMIPKEARVLGFIGQIREYKNVTGLLEVFNKIKDTNIYLIIAGKPISETLRNEIVEKALKNDRVKLHLNFIPNEDIQIYMNAADVIVLPYTEILNSGSALLSLSFFKPILVPNKGALKELRMQVGSDWVYTYDGAINEKVILKTFESLKTKERKPLSLDALDWRKLSNDTLDFYKYVNRNSVKNQN